MLLLLLGDITTRSFLKTFDGKDKRKVTDKNWE